MFKFNNDPEKLAIYAMSRSKCSVMVGAVIKDRVGIISIGWNSVGKGFGEHAEASAIRRANRKRLVGATIYVAASRGRNGKRLNSLPCEGCLRKIRKAGIIKWTWTSGEESIWGMDWDR